MTYGYCLCQNVKITVEGEPENVRICHCLICQKAMGSPFFARALFRQINISVDGHTEAYSSSDLIRRVFCPTCGTTLGAWRQDGSMVGLSLAVFDDPNTFAPDEHIWTSEKIKWVNISDGLPQFLYSKT